MQHSFFQKAILVILAGALVASFYVYVYKGIIVSAEKSVNSPAKSATAP